LVHPVAVAANDQFVFVADTHNRINVWKQSDVVSSNHLKARKFARLSLPNCGSIYCNVRLETIDDLLRRGSLTVNMARFLEVAVEAKLNIIISGGTGTGKTTLLNILSGFLGEDERIITIEDAAELKLHQNHVISLETRLINYEGEGEVTIRDLVRNSLRMRPDRIIVGEVRGKEAFDMMQAMNTGHEGSLTTLHANNPIDALNRLETMILMNEMEIPVSAVRGYIENAIDIIVQIDRLSDGKRKITSISELEGIKDGEIIVKDIFTYKQKGLSPEGNVVGEFGLYKRKPKVYDKILRKGFTKIKDIFE
jgi:pilus assembly protein CpaF